MIQFYAIDSTRVSHLEYLWWHKSPLVIFSWLNKWLRVPSRVSADDPNTESTLPFVVEALPPEIASGFVPLTNALAELGFFDPVYHAIADTGTRTTIYWTTFRHESGKHFARIHQRLWHQAANPNRALFPMFFTAFTDGTFLVSSAGKPDMAEPKTVQMNRMPRVGTERLWARHQQLLVKLEARKNIVPVNSREDLIELTERHHVLVRDFHLARGVFRLRTEAEQQSADDFVATVEEAKAAGVEHAEILAEMRNLQEKKPGWGSASRILVISVVLFVALGAARWNWRYTLLLIPVLLFHECGHWVAMRIFHYRNLRMFFIPLFGAAVTGQHWNVPGWKKAIVSLAGPLPGIALGVLLGIFGLVMNQSLLTQVALLLVFINGLNLLPVLPLDGGRVLQTVLFCRNRWLSLIFQILAVVGLLLLGAFGLGRLSMYLAIIMAISLPVVFKLGKVTDKLRGVSLPPPLPGEDQIPVATAQAIITEVKAAFPKGASNKALAQHSLSVFETLNAKPPTVLATIGLLAVHGGAFFVSVVFSALLIIGRFGGLGDFFQSALHQPQHLVQCGSVRQWQGADAAQKLSSPHNLLVATYHRHDQAAEKYDQLTGQLSSGSRLTVFGDSLLLATPAGEDDAREKWFGQFPMVTTNIFVTASNQPIGLNLRFIAPTISAATNLLHELSDYLEADADMHLVPPWSLGAQAPGFEAFRHARREWKQISLELAKVDEDPAMVDVTKQMSAVMQHGSQPEITRLEDERNKLEMELQAKVRDQLRAVANRADSALIDLNAAFSQLDETNQTERGVLSRKIAAQLGEVKYDGDHPASGANAEEASGGLVSRHSLVIEVTWTQLNDASVSLPELSGWLCDHGCIAIKYDLVDLNQDSN